MGLCRVLPHLCPLPAETVVVGGQQWLPCGYIGTVSTGQEPVIDGFPASPYSIQIPYPCHQGPGTYVVILEDHSQQSTVLTRRGLPRSPSWLAWHQSSSGDMPPEDAVDGSMSQTHATRNSTLPHALLGKCKHFLPNTYRGGRGIIRYLDNDNWEKICNCWF